jgi:acetyltransferase-like isoleucine patch superfamily enzyme
MRRKLFRIYFYSCKFFIGLLAYLNSRIYMRCFNWLLRQTGIHITGTPRFIANSVKFDDFDKISLGDRLVVSMNVYFLTHDYSFTTALISINEQPKADIGILRKIIVGDNVFIGMNSILLPGTKIGNHVIVGAGSVVRGEIEDHSIVAGNPAVKVADIREYAQKTKKRSEQDWRLDKA